MHEAINRDEYPTLYQLVARRQAAELGEVDPSADSATGRRVWGIAGIVLLVLAAVFLGRRGADRDARAAQASVLTSGAVGLGCQSGLMLVYQTATGALYREMALLFAAAMLGAAVGALVPLASARRALVCDVAMGTLALAAFALTPVLLRLGPQARFAILPMTLAFGAVQGAQMASLETSPRSRGALYAADLVGSAGAATVTLPSIVPSLGIRHTFLVLMALKAGSMAVRWLSRRAAPLPDSRPLRALTPLLLLILVLLAVDERTHGTLASLSHARPFVLVAALVLVLPLAQRAAVLGGLHLPVQARRLESALRAATGIGLRRWLFFLVLAPLAAFPIARCYFLVPFVLCHACPRRCVFGELRTFVVASALLQNLDNSRFCTGACPLGTSQDGARSCAGRPAHPRPQLSALLRTRKRFPLATLTRWLALAAVVALYWSGLEPEARPALGSSAGVFVFVFKNVLAPSAWVLLIALGVLVASFFLPPPILPYALPIGATSSVLHLLDARMLARKARAPTTSEEPL